MKTLRLFGFALLMISLGFVSCGDDDEEENDPQNIVELASDTDNLSSLVAALDAADLVSTLEGAGPFTVFAPTNAAFDKFLTDNGYAGVADVPVDALRNILLNHVVGGKNLSTGLTTGYVESSATGAGDNTMNMYISTNGGVTINGGSTVTAADIDVSNGVIHIVDAVIGLPTVVTFATADPTFSTLVAALTRESLGVDYVGTLSAPGPLTVFAPTNDAFGALLTELSVGGLADIDDATLNGVLQYHVVAGANVRAADLTEGQVVSTFGGAEFTIDLSDGASITDANERNTKIVVTDVQANNGVIHVVSQVLLP
ncbi:MAG: putative surface protein with fasciclin (FAS1) repeats [Saprospiraceae bacterium]|jgi:uncharacterized surface protein with fasciclin (FAS1) repeats